MAHFKPFFYTTEDLPTGPWKRLFVEPGAHGMIRIEALSGAGDCVEFNMPPDTAFAFADRLYDAADVMENDDRDWVGERI